MKDTEDRFAEKFIQDTEPSYSLEELFDDYAWGESLEEKYLEVEEW